MEFVPNPAAIKERMAVLRNEMRSLSKLITEYTRRDGPLSKVFIGNIQIRMEFSSEVALQLRKNNRLLVSTNARVVRNFVTKKIFIGKPITFERHAIIEVPKSIADEMISF